MVDIVQPSTARALAQRYDSYDDYSLSLMPFFALPPTLLGHPGIGSLGTLFRGCRSALRLGRHLDFPSRFPMNQRVPHAYVRRSRRNKYTTEPIITQLRPSIRWSADSPNGRALSAPNKRSCNYWFGAQTSSSCPEPSVLPITTSLVPYGNIL